MLSPEVIFEVQAPIRSAIIAQEGVLYFGDENCRFYAVDGETGDLLWNYVADDAVECRPVISQGRVVFNAANTLYVLGAADGKELGKVSYPVADTLRVSDDPWAWNDSSVAVHDDMAWFALLSGDIVEVDLTGGTILRTHPARNYGEVASGVDYLDGRLLWVDHAGELVALDIEDWQEGFRTSLDDRIFAPMCINDNKIYLAGRSCKMYCVDCEMGEILWSSFSQDPTTWFSGGSVVVGDTLWACTSDEHTILLLDKNTGAFKDLLPIHTNGYTQPVKHGNRVIVVATDVYTLGTPDARADIVEFDTTNNKALHHKQLSDGVLSSPVVFDGVLYFGSESGRVYRSILSPR